MIGRRCRYSPAHGRQELEVLQALREVEKLLPGGEWLGSEKGDSGSARLGGKVLLMLMDGIDAELAKSVGHIPVMSVEAAMKDEQEVVRCLVEAALGEPGTLMVAGELPESDLYHWSSCSRKKRHACLLGFSYALVLLVSQKPVLN